MLTIPLRVRYNTNKKATDRSQKGDMGEKGKKTRNLILQESKRLFSTRGFKAVSMQNICDATGLSKGGLYRHYGNKEEILLELLHKDKSVTKDIENGKSATEVLENLLDIYYRDMVNNEESLALALFEYATLHQEHPLSTDNRQELIQWRKLVTYGVTTGEFNNVPAEIVMDTFLYAYRGIMLWSHALNFHPEIFDHLLDSVRYILIKNYNK